MIDIEKYKSKIENSVEFEPTTGCWLWSKHIHKPTGYGRIGADGKLFDTHRFSFLIYIGHIPNGMYVCHHCDTRSCVNPDHLFIGTQRDNLDDMVKKGRSSRGKERPGTAGELNHASVVTKKDVISIRKLYGNKKMTVRKMSKKFNISKSSIYRIIHYLTWKNI